MLYHWEIYLGGHRYTCLMPLSDIVTGHRTVCCLNLLMTHFVDKEENQTTTVAIYSTDTLYRCEHINLYFCFTSKLPDHRLCMTKVKDKTTTKKRYYIKEHINNLKKPVLYFLLLLSMILKMRPGVLLGRHSALKSPVCSHRGTECFLAPVSQPSGTPV